MTTGSGRAEYRDTERIYFQQCGQKSQIPEMTGSCSNTFVGKPTFCVEEAQLNQNMVECVLHYPVSI